VKFKVGDVIQRIYRDTETVYRRVCAINKCGGYELSRPFSTPSEAVYYKKRYKLSLSFKYVDVNYVLDTECQRRAEFNLDLKGILSA